MIFTSFVLEVLSIGRRQVGPLFFLFPEIRHFFANLVPHLIRWSSLREPTPRPTSALSSSLSEIRQKLLAQRFPQTFASHTLGPNSELPIHQHTGSDVPVPHSHTSTTIQHNFALFGFCDFFTFKQWGNHFPLPLPTTEGQQNSSPVATSNLSPIPLAANPEHPRGKLANFSLPQARSSSSHDVARPLLLLLFAQHTDAHEHTHSDTTTHSLSLRLATNLPRP